MKLWLDLETFSDIPLDYGVYRYAEKARILLCAYAVDDAPARCVDCAAMEPMPADFTAALKNPEELLCDAPGALAAKLLEQGRGDGKDDATAAVIRLDPV